MDPRGELEFEGTPKPCRLGVVEDGDDVFIVDRTCHEVKGDFRILKMVHDSEFQVKGSKDLAEAICTVVNLALDREKVNRFH